MGEMGRLTHILNYTPHSSNVTLHHNLTFSITALQDFYSLLVSGHRQRVMKLGVTPWLPNIVCLEVVKHSDWMPWIMWWTVSKVLRLIKSRLVKVADHCNYPATFCKEPQWPCVGDLMESRVWRMCYLATFCKEPQWPCVGDLMESRVWRMCSFLGLGTKCCSNLLLCCATMLQCLL